MEKKSASRLAFFNLRPLIAFLVCGTAACSILSGAVLGFLRSEAPAHGSQRMLTFAERVAYQYAIEEVYWRHRIWPKERPDPKPPLEKVMSQTQLQGKVEVCLRKSQLVADQRGWPITASELQAEMDRMAQHTKQPEVLGELFEALGNDRFVIAECLARPVLADRLLTSFYAHRTNGFGCVDDTWTATSTANAPEARAYHAAVWTGSEMIVWGGAGLFALLNTGGKYNPSTDSWTVTSTTNAPSGRQSPTAVWTGNEMIIWGGWDGSVDLNTGGRYNPSTDSWMRTTTTNAPSARIGHTAVWTGSEMIIWGGWDSTNYFNTGGRYNPATDSWTVTSTTNAPSPRVAPTAVWTGNEMIIWGGYDGSSRLNTGGRYNPDTDSWTATSTASAPSGRELHTAIWTGSEMIVWAGIIPPATNTGGRYNPSTDSWMPTSITNAPPPRYEHTAVWTASEMIIWGGNNSNTGGRYDPGSNSWTATSTTNAPSARNSHTAVWSGSEMIVWGGYDLFPLSTGGRYCAHSGPTPTPTPSVTPTATATPTPGQIMLRAKKKRIEGINTVRLQWRGATSANIDVYRNNVLIVTTPNDGQYDDSTGDTGRARYVYRVCQAGTQTCSNDVTVHFPP
jgi:N-acetylneuraminic acid mutarotase